MEICPRLTHHDVDTGYRRWELALPTGAYMMTATRPGIVSLFPLDPADRLVANPNRATALMRAWLPLSDEFREQFEQHLTAGGVDPLSATLIMHAVRDVARRAHDGIS